MDNRRGWVLGLASLILLALLLLFFSELAKAQQSVVYRRVFSGITGPAVSTPLDNVGQSQHVWVVIFPGAVVDVSPIQVRVEGSYDNSYWFPIGEDIVQAKYFAGIGRCYNMNTAYAPYPYVRMRSLVSTPGARPMDVFYVGNVVPVVPVIIQVLDRFVL